MKKKLLFVLSVFSIAVSAQNAKVANGFNTAIEKNNNIAASISTATTTALIPQSFAVNTCSLYNAAPTSTTGLGGYVTGNNQFNDKEKAMKFSLSANNLGLPATVNQVSLFIGEIKAGGAGTGVISVKVYANNAGLPGALLGTSATRTISTLTANSFTPNIFSFAAPVALTSNDFFVAADFSAAGPDTLGLAFTESCPVTSTTSAIEKDGGNNWATMKQSWNITADLGIFPVVTAENAVGLNEKNNAISSLNAFPNPAMNEISINFGLNQASKIEIEVYDVTGKVVMNSKLDNLEVGNHTSKLNISNLNSGVYMYSVKSENAKMYSRFSVAK